jgi:glucose-1-phosphate adenylyltransferase
VELLAAEQTEQGDNWFRGTADAVRQSARHLDRELSKQLLILGGDQLYRMDFKDMMRVHRESRAAATVAIKAVPADQTAAFGIMKVASDGRIVHFEEKPPAERLPHLVSTLPGSNDNAYLASMGIYIFERQALREALATDTHIDFGRHVIPAMLSRMRVQSYVFDGYWEDVGSIKSYYEANLALTRHEPHFSFYHPRCPIYTHPRFLAPTKLRSCRVRDALIADGCYIEGADIETSVVGIRSRIGEGVRLRRTLMLGADEYESPTQMQALAPGVPPVGIGAGTIIEGAIIDKDARIGRQVRITNERGLREHDGGNHFIREGVVVVPKAATIPDGTVI